jgi:hypothetical protein
VLPVNHALQGHPTSETAIFQIVVLTSNCPGILFQHLGFTTEFWTS